LGGRKGIRPVKTEWWGVGVVVCSEQGADIHNVVQLYSVCVVGVGDKVRKLERILSNI